jgi:hypothetical protein
MSGAGSPSREPGRKNNASKDRDHAVHGMANA